MGALGTYVGQEALQSPPGDLVYPKVNADRFRD